MTKKYLFVFLLLLLQLASVHGQTALDSLLKQTELHLDTFKLKTVETDNQYFTTFLSYLEQQKDLNSELPVQQAIDSLNRRTRMAYLERVQSIYQQLDSIEHTKELILTLNPSKEELIRVFSFVGWAYRQKQNYTQALSYYYQALEVADQSTNTDLKIGSTNIRRLIIGLLIEIKSFHHANLLLEEAKLYLNQFRTHAEYNFYQDVLSYIEAMLNIDSKQPEKALKVLQKIHDKENHRYYNLMHKAYYQLKAYNESGEYLELVFVWLQEKKIAIRHKYYKSYYYHKLRLSLAYNSLNEAEGLFVKIQELYAIDSEINPDFLLMLHDYYKQKGDISTAYNYFLKASEIQAKNDAINTKQRIEVDAFLLNRDQTINKLKTDLFYKDLLIANNKKLFLLSTLIGVLGLGFFFVIVYYQRKKKTLALQYQLDSATKISKAKSEYLENVTHEIRTPITIVNGYLTMLQQNALQPKKVKEYSELGQQTVANLLNALNNYLQLFSGNNSNNNTARNQTSAKANNSMQHIKDLITSFSPLAELANISLYFKTNIKAECKLELDSNSIENILNNLISNALKYTHAGGEIFVSVVYKPNVLHIKVKDTGIGMSENDVSQIFSRFYQSEENTHNTKGFGIGLSIVKELINQLGGKIHVSSELHKGSSFKIEIPLSETNQVELHHETEVQYQSVKPMPDKESEAETEHNKPQILIVDDNLDMLRYLKVLFSQDYQCFLATNGKEALNVLKTNKPQLIISDVRMPLLNGLDLKEQLNQDEHLKTIPFIIITAQDLKDKEQIKLRLGIDEYLIKPFSTQEIEMRVLNSIKKQSYRQVIEPDTEPVHLENDAVQNILDKLLELVRKNLADEHYKVANVVNDMGYSQHQLNAILKQHMGITLNNLMLEIRLLTAYDYIVKRQKNTLNEVIYAIGLNSRTYFNTRFYKRFGIKPGELMKQHKL